MQPKHSSPNTADCAKVDSKWKKQDKFTDPTGLLTTASYDHSTDVLPTYHSDLKSGWDWFGSPFYATSNLLSGMINFASSTLNATNQWLKNIGLDPMALGPAGRELEAVLEFGSTLRTFGVVKYESSFLHELKDITDLPKGSRPDPTTYLSKEYIAKHLAQFEDGVTKIKAMPPEPGKAAGPEEGAFFMPTSVVDSALAKANGNVSMLEKILGFKPGELGSSPVRIDIPTPQGFVCQAVMSLVQMPSGFLGVTRVV